MFRPRLGPLGAAFLVTLLWTMLNLRRVSPVDVLPFAWTWLTLWLAFSVASELWRRYRGLQPARPRRRRA